jgi:hypothetical protein
MRWFLSTRCFDQRRREGKVKGKKLRSTHNSDSIGGNLAQKRDQP